MLLNVRSRWMLMLASALPLLSGGLAVEVRSVGLPPELENEQITGINKEPPHATLMPYSDLGQALQAERRHSPYARDLNGTWKFHWVGNPSERPIGFEQPGYDVSGWKSIPVPSNWQM